MNGWRKWSAPVAAIAATMPAYAYQYATVQSAQAQAFPGARFELIELFLHIQHVRMILQLHFDVVFFSDILPLFERFQVRVQVPSDPWHQHGTAKQSGRIRSIAFLHRKNIPE